MWSGSEVRHPKPLSNLQIFPTLFMTRPNISNPNYDSCSWHSFPKHDKFKGLLSMVLSIMKKKQLSLALTYLTPKWPKSISYLWSKRLNPFWVAHTFIGHVREYLSPSPPVDLTSALNLLSKPSLKTINGKNYLTHGLKRLGYWRKEIVTSDAYINSMQSWLGENNNISKNITFSLIGS